MRIVAFVSCCVVLGLVSDVRGYIGSNRGLSTIPNNIATTDPIINLRRNIIVSLDTFPAFSALVHLDLTSNLLVAFPNVCSVGATLHYLSVTRNRISVIEPARLDCLVAIESLDLTGNAITSIPDVSGPGLTLTDLRFDKNKFNSIPRLAHLGSNLTRLYVGGNKLDMVTATDLRQFTSLVNLNIGQSQLKSFPDISVLAHSLVFIEAQDNYIADIPTEVLNKMTKLQYMWMRTNKLRQFPDFCNSPSKDQVRHLDLSFNDIRIISVELLKCLSVVEMLNLRDNPLTSFPNVCHMTSPPSTIMWDLPSASMTCDCHLRWLKGMMEANNLNKYFLGYMFELQPCKEPADLLGVPWYDLQIDNLTCEGK
jgi:Leucine-rich repeat (LRR) protein